jgi:hypothetical protein
MLKRLRTKRLFALLLVSLLAIGATVWRACIVSKGADDVIEPDSHTAAIHEFDARDVLDPFAHVTEAMRPQFETANPSEMLEGALQRLQSCDMPRPAPCCAIGECSFSFRSAPGEMAALESEQILRWKPTDNG